VVSASPPSPPSPPPPPPPVAKKSDDGGGDDVDVLSPITKKRNELYAANKHLVWGATGPNTHFLPAPVLPHNPAEVATLDPVETSYHRTNMDGTIRTVMIRQDKKSMRQAPLNPERTWRIHLYEDGKITEKWNNPLMGWTSNADPYQTSPPLTFRNAAEAVYFAQKRGWHYIVKAPIQRYARRDDAQYQDNFLPQHIAAMISNEGISCDYWHRTLSGTSHYFRPLSYHGSKKDTTTNQLGVVRQHGSHRDHQPYGTDPHVPGYYKRR
jgi:hypothetical protein